MLTLEDLPLPTRLAAVSILSVAGWEMLKHALRDHLGCTYFRRESSNVVIKVKVMPWDKSGKTHFQGQGYTREYPLDDEHKAKTRDRQTR